jgi:hypothetical protein
LIEFLHAHFRVAFHSPHCLTPGFPPSAGKVALRPPQARYIGMTGMALCYRTFVMKASCWKVGLKAELVVYTTFAPTGL